MTSEKYAFYFVMMSRRDYTAGSRQRKKHATPYPGCAARATFGRTKRKRPSDSATVLEGSWRKGVAAATPSWIRPRALFFRSACVTSGARASDRTGIRTGVNRNSRCIDARRCTAVVPSPRVPDAMNIAFSIPVVSMRTRTRPPAAGTFFAVGVRGGGVCAFPAGAEGWLPVNVRNVSPKNQCSSGQTSTRRSADPRARIVSSGDLLHRYRTTGWWSFLSIIFFLSLSLSQFRPKQNA
jgi:hypothetical protein